VTAAPPTKVSVDKSFRRWLSSRRRRISARILAVFAETFGSVRSTTSPFRRFDDLLLDRERLVLDWAVAAADFRRDDLGELVALLSVGLLELALAALAFAELALAEDLVFPAADVLLEPDGPVDRVAFAEPPVDLGELDLPPEDDLRRSRRWTFLISLTRSSLRMECQPVTP